MMELAALDRLVDADNRRAPTVTGSWFPIQLVPDLASDERINVGVAFVDGRGQLHARLVNGLHGLGCLYGRAAARNFQFLLALAAEHLQRGGQALDTISPQLKVGPARYAAGASVESILDSFFATAVSLAWHETDAKRHHPGSRDTAAVRDQVFRGIRKHAESTFRRAIREQPVVLRAQDGTPFAIDMPIWMDDRELFAKPRYGTVISAYFSSEAYRGFSLLSAYRDMTIARQYAPVKAEGAAFILRPPQVKFERRMMEAIEQDIAQFAEPIKKLGLEVVVKDDTNQLTNHVLEFIGG